MHLDLSCGLTSGRPPLFFMFSCGARSAPQVSYGLREKSIKIDQNENDAARHGCRPGAAKMAVLATPWRVTCLRWAPFRQKKRPCTQCACRGGFFLLISGLVCSKPGACTSTDSPPEGPPFFNEAASAAEGRRRGRAVCQRARKTSTPSGRGPCRNRENP